MFPPETPVFLSELEAGSYLNSCLTAFLGPLSFSKSQSPDFGIELQFNAALYPAREDYGVSQYSPLE